MVELDERQRAAVDAPAGPVAILAGPGSGKTATMVARIEKLCADGAIDVERSLALTHTTKAAGELRNRLRGGPADTVAVSTIHAAAWRCVRRWWGRAGYEGEPQLAASTFGLVRRAAESVIRGKVETSTISDLASEIDWARACRIPRERYSAEVKRRSRVASVDPATVTKVWARFDAEREAAGVIDFADVISIATDMATDSCVADEISNRIDALFVDEYQDVDDAQQALIEAWLGDSDRLSVVGDPDQCHPPGTMISTACGPIPIEELDPDRDHLRCLDHANSIVLGGTSQPTHIEPYPLRVGSRPYSGHLIHLHAGGREVKVTPEHLCLVKWDRELFDSGSIVYVMSQGNRFRIGRVRLSAGSGMAAMKLRMLAEGADRLWILTVCSTFREAATIEARMAAAYGVPDNDFQPSNRDVRSAEDCHSVFDRIPDLEARASALLQAWGRRIEHPFLDRAEASAHQHDVKAIMKQPACNVIGEAMLVGLEPDGGSHKDRKVAWTRVSVSYSQYQGRVYSLDVEPHHNYFADGVLVHNCIFAFKGAHSAHLERFSTRWPTATVVSLVDNHRSTSEVVGWVNRLASAGREPLVARNEVAGSVRAHSATSESSEEAALVHQLREWHGAGFEWGDMAVLYRFNATSARLESALLEAGIPHEVAGAQRFFERDEVRAVLVPFGQRARREPDSDGLATLVDVAEMTGWSAEHPPAGVGAARQRWEAVSALVSLVGDQLGQLSSRWVLSELQQRAIAGAELSLGGVTLATVHAAKGLEWECVWVAGMVEGQMPSSFAKTDDALAEERRVAFVAISRARRHLAVSHAEKRHNNWRDRPSRFLDQLGAHTQPVARRKPPADQTAAHGSKVGECDRCSGRLTSAEARTTRRCSGDCLEGAARRRWDELVRWRRATAKASGVSTTAVATDRALFVAAVRGSSDGVTGFKGTTTAPI